MPGLIARIAQAFRPAELRDGDTYASAVGFGLGPMTGNFVDARLAENLSTVTAAVNAITSAVATMPAFVYRRTDTGREELLDHPVASLIRRPNDRQTWPDFLEMLLASTLLHGNAIAIVEADGTGRPTALVPVPWQFVLPQLLPTGRLAFDVMRLTLPWGGVGLPRRYLQDEVIHLKDRTDDGYLGRSRLSRAHEVLGTALGLQEFSAAIWRNSATPTGVLKTAAKLTPEARTILRENWRERYEGAHNARRTILLEQGVEFEAMAVSPEDAEVLASRRFTVEELCRLFQVPLLPQYFYKCSTSGAMVRIADVVAVGPEN